jgi:virginiamycin B lyase
MTQFAWRQRWLASLVATSLVALSLLPLVSCDTGGPTVPRRDPPPPDIPIQEYTISGSDKMSMWLNGITAGPPGDTHVWFTGFNWSEVGRVSATEPTPQPYPISAVSNPHITVGSDGHLWVTQTYPSSTKGPHTITCLTKDGGPCGVYQIPYVAAIDDPIAATGRWLWGITSADNGRLYYTERYASRIGCFDPRDLITIPGSGTVNFKSCGEQLTTTLNSEPFEITQALDGNLYFTEYAKNQIGCMTKTLERCGEWPVTGTPTGLTVGPDNELWFTESGGNKVARFSVSKHEVTAEVPLASGSQPWDITKGPPGDYAVWFTERGGNKIARFSVLDLDVFHYPPEEFPVPTANSEPAGIAVGPDHHIWFTEANPSAPPSKIGRTTRAYP